MFELCIGGDADENGYHNSSESRSRLCVTREKACKMVVSNTTNQKVIMKHHFTQEDNSALSGVLQELTQNGFEGLPQVLTYLINECMKLERQSYLGVDAYERNVHRSDYANGYKPKTVNTRIGKLALDIPQVRNGNFYPSCLERGLRSERVLNLALAEMYVAGVATRKVSKIVETMCGFEVSSSQVSRLNAGLDEELEKWRNRPIGCVEYLLLDARYEKVRVDGYVRDCALLTAFAVDDKGKRSVLGLSVSLSEAEPHWREFLKSLTARGMHGTKMITSDSHAGLKAARKAIFPNIPWQRCQFHLQQNASSYVPKKEMQQEVHNDIRTIFNAPDLATAQQYLTKFIAVYLKKAPKLAEWMELNIPEGLTVFMLNETHRKKLRTTNMVERQNAELAKRTRVVNIFPNEQSLLRLASAMLMELDEDWQGATKSYIAM